MALKCGIVGLPNVGKSTLFNCLSSAKAQSANFPFCTIEPNIGVITVPDERLIKLTEIDNPKKVVPTTIEIADIAGVSKDEINDYNLTDIEFKATQFLMNEYEWDFFMMYFRQTDLIQHYFWKYMDKNHPLFEKKESIKYGKKILELYEKMDIFLSYILKKCTNQTNIIIMSDHGFGPNYGQFNVSNWLFKYGYLKMKQNVYSIAKKHLASAGLTKYALQELLSIFGFELRKFGWFKESTVNVKETILKKIFLSLEDIDWSRTKAFSFGTFGPIYINVKKKFPKGNVKTDYEYEKIRSEIKERLSNKDESKDINKIIDKILFKEDIYFGPFLKESADIHFLPTGYTFYSHFDELGSKRLISKPINNYSGNHRLDGILIMRGPNIKKESEMRRSKIIDLHPTIMHLMGCPVNYNLDGKILREAMIDN